jgi:hypothetical protein
MLLAGPGDDGFFRIELVKLLQTEQKERERGDAAAACRKDASESVAAMIYVLYDTTSDSWSSLYDITISS